MAIDLCARTDDYELLQSPSPLLPDNDLVRFFESYDPDGMRILEVQCGDGRLRDYLELAHPGFQSYLGVDSREWAIDGARRRRPDLSRDFAFRDLVALPLPDDCFDIIIAINDLAAVPDAFDLAKVATRAVCLMDSSGQLTTFRAQTTAAISSY